MVASKKREVPLFGGIGRQRGRGFGAFTQFFGGTPIPFLRLCMVPAAKHVGADLLEFTAPEIAEVVCGRKNFRTAAKSVGRQTLRKQLGSGSGRETAGIVNPIKTSKHTKRSRNNIYNNISQLSCRTIFGTNFLRRFPEILEGKSE